MKLVNDDLVEDALRELADEERQRTLWLSTGEPEVSSFEESLSRLWDDSGLGTAMEKPGVVYNSEIDELLRRLDETLAQVNTSQPVSGLLVDPHLAEARVMARRLLQELRRFGYNSTSSP
jgi:hypothetical protein